MNYNKQRYEKSHAKICAMSNMYIDGHSTGEIAKVFECSQQNVCFLLQEEYGKDWKDVLKSRRETLKRHPWKRRGYRVHVPYVLIIPSIPSQEW